MFLHKFALGPLRTNTILFGCEKSKKGVVIDPSQGAARVVCNKAQELGVEIEKILLTHSHWDHFVVAYLLKDEIKAPLYVHALDAQNLMTPGSDKLPLFISIHPVQPDGFLAEGDSIFIGDLKGQVIHTPGHSPGGVCFWFPDEKILFSGDTLFRGTMGALHLPTADASQMWISLAKLAKLPSQTRVIPGHGEETTIGAEVWLNNK